ncbi:carbohydrate ABC transporter permease [Paenibacillus thalictri]|uniref:Carbohydrate ABC transporter permease n=1 Tax=Paenibacillus thalictri TaxID=2527873 RepID=A0A4V2J500_9BACL|nr:carbohydrate ABC transporter permease [Paenibacillus thalictri]
MYAIKKSAGSQLFDVSNIMILSIFSVATLYPLWHEVSLSLSSMEESMRGGLFIWPKEFTLSAYMDILKSQFLWVAYQNTVIITAAGTLLSLLLTAMTAYPLVKRGLPGNHVMSFVILFTMLFGGGIIPTYLLIKQLGMINSLSALIIPGAISAYNVLIMRSFFAALPAELEESAMMDGANPIRIFFTIILPLSTPVLATIALWEAVSRWNNFFSALIYLNDKSKYTLSLMLWDVIKGQEAAKMSGQLTNTSTESAIAATVVLATLPILCVYPFLQRYFVKGVMIGSIKS